MVRKKEIEIQNIILNLFWIFTNNEKTRTFILYFQSPSHNLQPTID